MTSTQNLEDLKVGDKVLVDDRNSQAIRTVAKVTKAHIVVGDTRYHRLNGRRVGDGVWDNNSIRPATDEDVARLRLAAAYNRAIRRLEQLVVGSVARDRLRALPIEALTQAADLLDAADGS